MICPINCLRTIAPIPMARRWAVCGLSEGGFGAVNLVCRHPDRFRMAMALSGMFAPDPKIPETRKLLGNDPANRAAYTPLLTVKNLTPTRDFFFALAVGKEDRYDNGETSRFAARLTEVGIPHSLQSPHGGHTWAFWSQSFEENLPLLGKRWREQASVSAPGAEQTKP